MGRTPPRMAILPLGTTEQHGRHLPVDVDVKNCWEIAGKSRPEPAFPVLPPLPYGDSRFWAGWPGTLTLQPETLLQIILEIADGVVASGFRRLLLLNGHIGNGPALAMVEGLLRDRHPGLQVRASAGGMCPSGCLRRCTRTRLRGRCGVSTPIAVRRRYISITVRNSLIWSRLLTSPAITGVLSSPTTQANLRSRG